MAATSSLRPAKKGDRGGEIITIRLVPLAWTPRGVAVGTALQDVGIPLSGLFDWIDRTFPPEDEGAFIASVRDVEILARTRWETPFPQVLDERSVLLRHFVHLADSLIDLLGAFQGLVDRPETFEWRGIELFWARNKAA